MARKQAAAAAPVVLAQDAPLEHRRMRLDLSRNLDWPGTKVCDRDIMHHDCPMQLVMKDGKPALRLCSEPNKVGKLVVVEGGLSNIVPKAIELCDTWKRTRSFDEITDYAGLGRARRRRRRGRGRSR